MERWGWWTLIALVACRDPTQIKLDISTKNIACADLADVAISTGRLADLEGSAITTSTTACDPQGHVGTLVLLPSTGTDPAGVRVVAALKNTTVQDCIANGYKGGCIVARRAVSYVPHTSLVLPIVLEASCIDVPCDATQTCDNGLCVPASIGQCDGNVCSPDLDAAVPPDAASPAIAHALGGAGDDRVTGLARDSAGNLYVAGTAVGSASFGGPPAAGNAQGSAFAASYDAGFGFRWQYLITGPSGTGGTSIAVGSTEALLGGIGGAPIDFGGTAGVLGTSGTTPGWAVTLASAAGTAASASIIGGTSGDYVTSVAFDAQGNTYVGGLCNPGTTIGNTACGALDGFVVSFDPTGALRWGDVVTSGAMSDVVTGLSVDGTHVYAVGSAEGTQVNFGGGGSGATGAGGDAFVVSYAESGGGLEWAKLFGDAARQDATAVAASGNIVYVAGSFAGTLVPNVTATAQSVDAFLLQLDVSQNGALARATRFGGAANDVATSVTIASSGDVYVCGSFAGAVDFGSGVVNAVGPTDIFVVALTSSGTYRASHTYSTGGQVTCAGIVADGATNAVMAGTFDGTLDFGGGASLTSAGGTDGYVVRLTP